MFDLSGVTKRVSDVSGLVTKDGEEATERGLDPNNDGTDIEFLCKDEYYGAIPEPVPANNVLPEWYKNLEQYMTDGSERTETDSSTVKRCMPFLDALTMGWIIPLAGEVEFHSHKDEDGYIYVNYEWNFDEELVSNHNPQQVGGDDFPMFGVPLLKFHNMWTIRVPDGYSVLFTKPFNRIENRFQMFSGVVDCDHYFNNVHLPFMWLEEDYDGVMDAGTPLVQAIPFKRDSMLGDAIARPYTDGEVLEKSRTVTKLKSEESMYRNERWQAKRGTRTLDESE